MTDTTTTPIGDLKLFDEEDMTGVISFHSEDNKTILRMERDGTLTLGEGLSQDEATQETARILKNCYDVHAKSSTLVEAAAPDMLEALEIVLNAHDYNGALTMGDAALSPAIRSTVERAIKKAKGEDNG